MHDVHSAMLLVTDQGRLQLGAFGCMLNWEWGDHDGGSSIADSARRPKGIFCSAFGV